MTHEWMNHFCLSEDRIMMSDTSVCCSAGWPSACSMWTAPCPPWPTRRTRRARARVGSWRRRWRRRSPTSWTKWRPWAKAPRWRKGARQRLPQWAELTPHAKTDTSPAWRNEEGDVWDCYIFLPTFTHLSTQAHTYTLIFGYELFLNGLFYTV